MMKRTGIVIVALVLFGLSAAFGEERFGVQVYPGAKYDAATSKALKETMGFNGECFRTNDPVAKVAEFYKKQGLENIGGVTKEGALFQKGNVDVTIQSPWMNMKTGTMMKDTLISIVNKAD